MLRILLCDDDRLFLERFRGQIREILDRHNIDASIFCFEQATSIPVQFLESCDIAFLDIDFSSEDFTGIDIARMIRDKQNNAVIIFVTNYLEYAPEGYEVQAFRYILKNEINDKLESYIRQALHKHQTVRQTMRITIAGETFTLELADILYIESHGHTAIIHVQRKGSKTEKTYQFYSSIGKLEQQLESKGFLRIQKGYLVNMAHIQKFRCHGAIMDNDICLPVSERNYAEQKKKYLLWKGMQ